MNWRQYVHRVLRFRTTQGRTRRRTSSQRPLALEYLEDRVVPTILFSSAGARHVADAGGPVVTHVQVDLIFWGSGWNSGGGPALRTSMTSAVSTLMGTPYLSGLSQYRGVSNGSLLQTDTITSTSPPNPFTDAQIQNFLVTNINNHVLRAPSSQIAYLVIPQPGSDTGTSVGGEHGSAVALSTRFHYGWSINNSNLDTLTNIYSHELTELVTDAEVNVNTAFYVPLTNDEIGDGEAQRYSYRLNGVLAQSSLSEATHTYNIYNGTVQNFFVSFSGVLTVNGDQLASHNDVIILDVSGGGVRVTLNGEVVQFDPGVIHGVVVNSGNGGDTIDVLRTLAAAPVTITSTSDATVNIGAGTVQGIQGSVSISNPPSFTTVNVNDSADSATHNNVVVTSGSITGLAPATISYRPSDVRALNISTGTGTSTVNIQSTPFALSGITIGANGGNETVNLAATSVPVIINEQPLFGNLTVNISSSAQNLNTIGGNVTVNGSRGQTTLNIFDQSDAGNVVWTVTPGSVTRATAPFIIAYSIPAMATGSLTIFGGSGISNTYSLSTAVGWLTTLNTGPGHDTINVVAVNHSVLSGGTLVVNAQGSGNDTVNIAAASSNLDTIRGNVTVNGNSGFDSLNILDQNSAPNVTWSITANSVQRTGSALVSYSGMGQVAVNGGSRSNTYNFSGTAVNSTTLNINGADTVNVQGTALLGNLTVNTNAGGATVNLTNGGTVDGIANVTVNDPTGTSTVVVDDSGFVGDETYAITNASVNVGRMTSALLSYSGIGNLVVNGGTSNNVQDTFNIDSTAANTTVNASPGVLNCFHVSPTAQWLGATILRPLTLNGGGGGADVLDFFDTNDPNSETFNFDAVPSMLTLGTTPGFLCNFSGFVPGSVYVLTNGVSTSNDASGTVVFDPAGGPPCAPGGPGEHGAPMPAVTHDILAQAVADVTRSQSQPVQAAVIPEVMLADLVHHTARKSADGWTVLALAAIAG